MTQEEKAKAYDMAIKKAMELLNSPRTCFDMEQLESIFPQLAESEEDETVVMSPYEVEFCQKFCNHTPDYYTSKGWKIIKNYYAEFKKIVMRELAEQKSEWNDEDERMMSNIITELANHLEYNKPLTGMPSGGWVLPKYQKEINWLRNKIKLFRDHQIKSKTWKPSKEQVSAIKFFLDFHHSQAVGATTEWQAYHGLESLYNELQTKL